MNTTPVYDICNMTACSLPEVVDIERQLQSHPWSHKSFQDGINAGYEAFIAMCNGSPVGYCMGMMAPDVAHVLVIGVHPQFQKKGIGRLLMTEFELRSLAHGLTTFMLEVRESNIGARSFYNRLGYQTKAVRKNYYPLSQTQRENALVMFKNFHADSNHLQFNVAKPQ